MAVIDLSRLPPPDVVEALGYDAILAAMTADLRARHPEFDAWVESEPALKLLEVAAYREMLLRRRMNDASRAVMLAFARGPDLDHLAALFGVARAEGEADARLLVRVQTALSGLSTAGSRDGYIHHALTADNRVRDVNASRTGPGRVQIVVLGENADGVPSQALVDKVEAAVDADRVRPLTDGVDVVAVTIKPYTIDATLTIAPGPSSIVVEDAARAAAEAYVEARNVCGGRISRAALTAALFVPGVTDVALAQPATDIQVLDGNGDPDVRYAPWCTDATADNYTTPTTHPLGRGITLTVVSA